ncbi:MAG TPA: hypothetical protein EYQ21_07000 [Flavobacteriales bacterium]|nr:hypothetical protein [Flavobacteriales bacterium]
MKVYDTVYMYNRTTGQIKSVVLAHHGLYESVLITNARRARTFKATNDLIFKTKKLAQLKRKEETCLPSAIQVNDMVLYNTFRRAALPYYSNPAGVIEHARNAWVPALVLKATPTRLTLMFNDNTLSTSRKNCALISKGEPV